MSILKITTLLSIGVPSMKLQEWVELSHIKPTHPTTEVQAVSVVIDYKNPHRTELWGLEDFAVSSACGLVIWLIPRNNIDKPQQKIQPFHAITQGTFFRFPGGSSTFLKVTNDWATSKDNPNRGCWVPTDMEVVPTGEWTNLQVN